MDNKTLYTIIVHSENIAGILNQITAVFTRRQINIESLNVSASRVSGRKISAKKLLSENGQHIVTALRETATRRKKCVKQPLQSRR